MSSTNDEINLLELYQAFKQTKFHNTLRNNIRFFLKNRTWLILFTIIGGTSGYLLERNIPPVYRTDMVVNSIEIDNFTCNQIICAIDTLIQENNIEGLENNGFSKELLSKIEFIYPKQDADSLKMNEPFKIAIYTTNNTQFELLENQIINYLNNTGYPLQIQKEKKELLITEISTLKETLIAIEKMQTRINEYLYSGRGSQTQTTFNPAALIKEKKEINLRLITLENELLNIENFVVLKSFTPRISPETIPKYYPIKMVLLSILIGFIILRLLKTN
jgi:hypothetical protein